MDFEKIGLKILTIIGKGTYGTVYLCENIKENNEKIVVKDIGTNFFNKEHKDADNEVKIISKLCHTNIIKYLDTYYHNGHVLISMEYATNGNLAQYMYYRNTGFISQQEVLFFFAQIFLAIDYIHEMNIIHRDLKAENILLTGKNGIIVKIGDFGIAKKLVGDQKTATVIGTPYYLAPELCDGKPYDTKTDVWALGCLLYEMCTHRRAFEAETLTGLIKEIVTGNVAPINTLVYDRSMQDLVDLMLSVPPEKRPTVKNIMGRKGVSEMVYSVFLSDANEDILNNIYCKIHI